MQLYNKNKQLLFDVNVAKCFASGGEGSICEHPSDKTKVVKVYHKPRGLKLEQSLLELNKLSNEFVKPDEIYYTHQGEIAGFSMRYVDMQKYVVLKKIFNTTFCLQNGFDKKIKYKIYQNLTTAVKNAHSLGIVIGDLNPYNILVNSTGEIVMLDVDSFGTKSNPHNGVLLEDIRDWVQHPKVDNTTDYFAFDVLTFWMFTFLHPFRGDYAQHKTLEERVCKKSSVLSNLPITIPKCYQPFTNQTIVDQFKQVFHDGVRFIVDLSGQPQILQSQAISQPAIIQSSDLYIRQIDSNIADVTISDNFIAYLKDGVWSVLSVRDFGVYNKLYTIADAQKVFVGNSNVIYQKLDYFWKESSKIKNISNTHGLTYLSDNNSVVLLSSVLNKYEILSIDDVLNDNILSNQSDIFVKSLQFGDGGIWQNIGDKKWLLDFNKNNFNIIKTLFNIKNVYKRRGYALIEHLENNKTRYTLCKIDGLNLKIGCDIPEWRYFDVKQGFVFVPEDGKINLINPINNWQIVSTIECSVCTFDSRIYHTNSGMVIQTGDSLFLINKKQ